MPRGNWTIASIDPPSQEVRSCRSVRSHDWDFLDRGVARGDPLQLHENMSSRLLMWFGYTDAMLWMSFVGALVVVLGVAVIVLSRRPGRDLGVVSSRWVEQHRLEP